MIMNDKEGAHKSFRYSDKCHVKPVFCCLIANPKKSFDTKSEGKKFVFASVIDT